jgi:hypothetical protein
MLGMLLAPFCGCSKVDKERPVRVAGEVKFKGQPVPFGFIVFSPDIQAGNSGPQGSAKILNGKFDTADGLNIKGGKYQVQIVGSIVDPSTVMGEELVEPMFPEYYTNVEINESTTSQVFDIK